MKNETEKERERPKVKCENHDAKVESLVIGNLYRIHKNLFSSTLTHTYTTFATPKISYKYTTIHYAILCVFLPLPPKLEHDSLWRSQTNWNKNRFFSLLFRAKFSVSFALFASCLLFCILFLIIETRIEMGWCAMMCVCVLCSAVAIHHYKILFFFGHNGTPSNAMMRWDRCITSHRHRRCFCCLSPQIKSKTKTSRFQFAFIGRLKPKKEME